MSRLVAFLAILALLASGCGGTTAQIGSGASDVVPASAPVFIAIDTNPESDQWQTVERLADKFPDKQKAIASLERELRKDPGVEWESDVKPALGDELDFAWLDFENDGENFVVLVQPHDDAAFKRLVEKANASEKDPSDRVTYEKFRGWYVLAEKQATIDRFERSSDSAARPLSDEPAFEHSMDKLGGDSIVRAYVNGPAVMDVARTYGGAEIQPYLDKIGKLDWIALRAGVKDDGVGLDAIVHGTPGKLFEGLPATKSFDPELPSQVPQDTLVYWTFHGSKGMLEGLQRNELFKTPGLKPLRDVLGDLDSLLQGENAFYVRPGNGRADGVPFRIPEITFIASPDVDGAGIVDRMLERELHVAPERTTIAGTQVRKFGEGSLGLYYANVRGRLVLTDMAAGIRGFEDGGKSLTDNDRYRDAADASGLPHETQGFLYVDIHSTIPWAEKLAQQHIPSDIRRNLKPLDSAVQYAVTRSHELQISFFLRLK
jgi:hypothetical protein